MALDLKSLTKIAEYRQDAPSTAAVGVPSPRGDRVAIQIDFGNHSTVRMLDAATLALITEVKTPLGTASLGINTEVQFPLAAGTFSADGERFVIGLSNPDAPDDVYVVDSTTGALAPLRHDPASRSFRPSPPRSRRCAPLTG